MKKLFLSLLIATSLMSGRAAVYTFQAVLSGANESPVNPSQGTGLAVFNYDSAASTLQLQLLFVGLSGTTTAAHVHAPTTVPFAGTTGVATTVPTFAGFPLGVTQGFYSTVLDLNSAASYNPAFITANGGTVAGAQLALVNAMFAGQSYLNIHTTVAPGGEIRGFLTPVPVPEPGMLALAAVGLGAVLCMKNKRHVN